MSSVSPCIKSSTALASADTFGKSNSNVGGMSRPKRAFSFAMAFSAEREWPPRSKKLTPSAGTGTFKTSSNMAFISPRTASTLTFEFFVLYACCNSIVLGAVGRIVIALLSSRSKGSCVECAPDACVFLGSRNAFRSTLPLGVSGKASSGTKAAGTM